MKIVLLRHGKPDVKEPGRIMARDLHTWIESYNSSGIHRDCAPAADALQVSSECRAFACSDLRRSMESAKLLDQNKVLVVDPIFREMGLPYANWSTPKASPAAWAAVFRLLWLLGYSENAESLAHAKTRATAGAGKLEQLAKEYGSVLHVGHGFMNKFIAKELLSRGWRGPKTPGTRYWGYGVYENHAT